MTPSRVPQWEIINILTTTILQINDSLLPMLVVESLSMGDIIVVVFTKKIDTKMLVMAYILAPTIIVPTEPEITLALP